jgi:predicted short-subunit dehydrogenase-like oxidoreductase (DUF2520 family)
VDTRVYDPTHRQLRAEGGAPGKLGISTFGLLCCASMKETPTISIIGAGSLAMALAPALRTSGYRIEEIISRKNVQSRRRAQMLARSIGACAVTLASARLSADVVWLCVSDGAIASCASELAVGRSWAGKYALHSSGALTSDELSALQRQGARVASVHPMMTFVRRSVPSLKRVGFAIEGDRAAVALARAIVKALGGASFSIVKDAKPLYHAWGAFGSPLLVMELAMAEHVARAAGINETAARRTIEPIVRRTIDNYFAHGAAAAFSGPLVRGDIDTVRRHLRELSRVPGAREVYMALVRTALETLPVARKQEIRHLLEEN